VSRVARDYVREFVEDVVGGTDGSVRLKEVSTDGTALLISYGSKELPVVIEEPGSRYLGRPKLLNYLRNYGHCLGLLIDVPTEEYYREYPRPYGGLVGFELYLGSDCVYERSFSTGEVSNASKELRSLLKVISEVSIASLEPTPENVLSRITDVVSKWEDKLLSLIPKLDRGGVSTYVRIWRRGMELLYGKEVLDSVGNELSRLFIELTIYTAILKILGCTVLESILGGGRYTIPIKLLQDGWRAATELFWRRKALTRFNINYVFERDEYDWIFSPEVAKEVDGFFRDVGRELIEIDWSRPVGLDLLKRIYQGVVDASLRRQLGEFYTPDWLAKLIVWRATHLLVRGELPRELMISNTDEDLIELINEYYLRFGRLPKFVDPTCGSFTFGIQYLDAVLKWYVSKKPKIHPVELTHQILRSVVGIDLNPVAVITAKVNYLLQIYKLLMIYGNYLYEEPMIPIYRIDLLVIHENKRTGTYGEGLMRFFSHEPKELVLYIPLSSLGIDEGVIKELRGRGLPIRYDRRLNEYYIRLSIPKSLIKAFRGDLLKLHRAFTALRIRGIEGFREELGTDLGGSEEGSLRLITEVVKVLENYGINHLWYSILMNNALALIASEGGFDLVLGNLPWVNVSKYPSKYGSKLREVAKELGVSPPKEAAKKLDVSVVLHAVSTKYLLRVGGVVGLMVPTSIFKGLHGSGWRSFLISEGLRIHEVIDLEGVQPFEGAKNQPGVVIAVKGGVGS